MNERERWIVYPLLFLALGAALRDKLIDRTTSGSIVCKELIVVDEEPIGREPFFIAKIGRVQPSAAGGQTGGYLVVNGQLSVNGTVDGQNYAVQGVPLALSVRAMIADLLQALQKSTQGWEQTNPPNSQPPESDPDADGVPATESAPAESSPQVK